LTIIDRSSSNDNVQEFHFASGSAIEVATFLGSDLVQSYSTRSRVECCTECSRKDNCLSIAYQDGICSIFSTYPDTMTSILGVHYIIYEQWCDVLNGFIYIREKQLCYKVIKFNMSCEAAGYIQDFCLLRVRFRHVPLHIYERFKVRYSNSLVNKTYFFTIYIHNHRPFFFLRLL
jgi:hypothetical protein